MIKKLTQITPAQLLAMLSETQQQKVKADSGLHGHEAYVIFENTLSDSPNFGKRTVIAVGEAHTHKTVADLHGAWLGEGPSRQDAIAYCLTPII